MKTFSSAAAGLACIVLAASALYAAPEKLTIEQSVEIALRQNPAVGAAREGVRKADALIDQAYSAGRPKVNLNGNYQRLDKATTANFGGQEVELGSQDSRTSDLVVTQPIDLFGTVKNAREAARVGRTLYEHDAARQVNDTILDTRAAFFGVLRAQEYLNVQQQTTNQLQAHLEDAGKQLRAGTIARFEVLRAETELANSRQGLIAAQNGVRLAKSAFNNVLGRPADTEVELAAPPTPPIMDFDQARVVQSAVSSRPEVLRAQSLVTFNEELTDVARLGNRPTLGFRWVYDHNFDTSLFNSRENSWTGFLSASMPLYDGGANRAAVHQAQSDTRTSRYVREQIVQGVTLDAQQALLSTRESTERMTAAQKGLDLAREAYRLANVRYQGGVSTQLEVLDAQTALNRAETNYVNALYDYQTALARLEHAVGGTAGMAKLTAAPAASPAPGNG